MSDETPGSCINTEHTLMKEINLHKNSISSNFANLLTILKNKTIKRLIFTGLQIFFIIIKNLIPFVLRLVLGWLGPILALKNCVRYFSTRLKIEKWKTRFLSINDCSNILEEFTEALGFLRRVLMFSSCQDEFANFWKLMCFCCGQAFWYVW